MATIRELRPDDDLRVVLTLCKAFFAEYEQFHAVFFQTEELTDADISGRFRESLTSDRSATIIAVEGGEIVGYALIAIREQPSFYKVKEIGAVSGLFVAEAHRRKGIAGKLLSVAEEWFRQRGIRYYLLYTAVSNGPAIGLYEHHGLTPLHTTFLGEM